MIRWMAVIFFSAALAACGGGGGGGSEPPEPASPPEAPLAGAWQGDLVYQSSQSTEPVKLAIYDDLAWLKIGGSKAAGFRVEKNGDEITLSGNIHYGYPVRWGQVIKHPAYKDVLSGGPEIELSVTFEGRDAIGSFEILNKNSPKDYGVFSLMPTIVEDGAWQPQAIREAEFNCGESGGYPLYCYSNIDLSLDSDGVISGEYRDYHKYVDRPPGMLAAVPATIEITGLSEGLESPGFYSIEVVSTRFSAKGFGYRKPSGELEYCLMGDTMDANPRICP